LGEKGSPLNQLWLQKEKGILLRKEEKLLEKDEQERTKRVSLSGEKEKKQKGNGATSRAVKGKTFFPRYAFLGERKGGNLPGRG